MCCETLRLRLYQRMLFEELNKEINKYMIKQKKEKNKE